MRTWVRDDEVDIQVGSCIFLNVCLFWSIAYALRWRVAHLARVIPLLSISSPRHGNLLFQVQGAHGDMARPRG